MKIILCSGAGELPYSGNWGIYRGLKSLGHEVLFCGPSYSYMGSNAVADIPLPDRQYPHEYTYDEILEKCPWQPSLIIQVEPHFSFIGSRPPEIPSLYMVFDPHRGLASWYRWAKKGKFTHLSCAQKLYVDTFSDLDMHVFYCPFGFSSERIDRDINDSPRCEISFCGETGGILEYDQRDEIGSYATKFSDYPQDNTRFKFHSHGGFDYGQRRELLNYLSKKFNLRMYDRVIDGRYQKVLQAGIVNFTRSLGSDVTFRIFESLAAGRLIICDKIEGQSDLLPLLPEFKTYPLNPLFENFLYGEGKNAENLIRYWINHNSQREHLASELKQLVWDKHKWSDRANLILASVFS